MENTCTCQICVASDKKRWETIEACRCGCHEANFPVGHERLCCEYPNGRKADNPYKKVNQALFTSEDGVDIFEGDEYYHICTDWSVQKENAVKYGIQEYLKKNIIRFSIQDKANEYVLMNKPCLSINDIVYGANGFTPPHAFVNNELMEFFKEIAKSKI